VAGQAQKTEIRTAVSTAYALSGGQNAAMVLRRMEA
jgi:hypothetical protein